MPGESLCHLGEISCKCTFSLARAEGRGTLPLEHAAVAAMNVPASRKRPDLIRKAFATKTLCDVFAAFRIQLPAMRPLIMRLSSHIETSEDELMSFELRQNTNAKLSEVCTSIHQFTESKSISDHSAGILTRFIDNASKKPVELPKEANSKHCVIL